MIYQELKQLAERLEDHYQDMQDIEFTIDDGQLFVLQTRNGKRTAAAAAQIATDMVAEGRITIRQALDRITPEMIDQLLHPLFAPKPYSKPKPLRRACRLVQEQLQDMSISLQRRRKSQPRRRKSPAAAAGNLT